MVYKVEDLERGGINGLFQNRVKRLLDGLKISLLSKRGQILSELDIVGDGVEVQAIDSKICPDSEIILRGSKLVENPYDILLELVVNLIFNEVLIVVNHIMEMIILLELLDQILLHLVFDFLEVLILLLLLFFFLIGLLFLFLFLFGLFLLHLLNVFLKLLLVSFVHGVHNVLEVLISRIFSINLVEGILEGVTLIVEDGFVDVLFKLGSLFFLLLVPHVRL